MVDSEEKRIFFLYDGKRNGKDVLLYDRKVVDTKMFSYMMIIV